MSAYDRLPEPLRRLLHRLAPGARIAVPKALSASERRSRDDRIRESYRVAIAAGGEPVRVVAGLALEYRVGKSTVWRIVALGSGTDRSVQDGG